jgi:hypothetical protein
MFKNVHFAGFVPLADYGGTRLEGVFNVSTPTNLTELVNNGFQIAIIVGASLAVMRIVYGGYLYMFSAAGTQTSKAKVVLKQAVLGLLLLLATYIILNQINPDILNLNAVLPQSNTNGVPTQQQTSPAAPINQFEFMDPLDSGA